MVLFIDQSRYKYKVEMCNKTTLQASGESWYLGHYLYVYSYLSLVEFVYLKRNIVVGDFSPHQIQPPTLLPLIYICKHTYTKQGGRNCSITIRVNNTINVIRHVRYLFSNEFPGHRTNRYFIFAIYNMSAVDRLSLMWGVKQRTKWRRKILFTNYFRLQTVR